ncbi:uncharacterized protein LOC134805882 [Cydia splendana]|uniref:uncharacterized protein LOC134805882 n=1 Tax=Cydia splendana TaxID=1100963 RepID=UPI00300C89CF
MLNRRSRTDETLRDYFYEKLALLSRCEIVGRKAVDCIIYGINDSSVRNGAQALKCEEPEDLLNYLASQQPSQSKDASRGPSTSNSSKRRDFRSNPSDKSSVSNRGVDSTCYNCHERGHVYLNCPKPIVKCGKCHRVGHNDENCSRRPLQTQPRNTSSSSSQPTDKKVLKVSVDVDSSILDEVERRASFDIKTSEGCSNTSNHANHFNDSVDDSANEKFHKTICVNEQMLGAYIDFGCARSLIRYTDAVALGLIKSESTSLPTLRGFGHSAVVPKAEATVHVRIDEVEMELNVLVVDDAYLEDSLMIGRDFTEKPCVTALKNNKQLFLYHTPSELSENQNQAIGLYILKDATVVKGGLLEIYTKDNYTGNVYSDGGTRMSPNQEYHLHQGYYEVKESRAVVFVTSLTKAPLNFRAGTLIARVNPITEVTTLVVQAEYNEREMKPIEQSEIRVGKGVDEETRERLHQLLQKYRSCFAQNLNELGRAKDANMNLDTR